MSGDLHELVSWEAMFRGVTQRMHLPMLERLTKEGVVIVFTEGDGIMRLVPREEFLKPTSDS